MAALDALAKVKAPADLVAQAELDAANVLFKMGNYSEAVRRYSNFLTVHLEAISAGPSRDYLRVYAIYHCDAAVRKGGQSVPETVTMEHLRGLALKARYIERKAFPPA